MLKLFKEILRAIYLVCTGIMLLIIVTLMLLSDLITGGD